MRSNLIVNPSESPSFSPPSHTLHSSFVCITNNQKTTAITSLERCKEVHLSLSLSPVLIGKLVDRAPNNLTSHPPAPIPAITEGVAWRCDIERGGLEV